MSIVLIRFINEVSMYNTHYATERIQFFYQVIDFFLGFMNNH